MSEQPSVTEDRTSLRTCSPTCEDDAARMAALEEYRLVPLGELSEAEVSTQIICDLEGLAEVAARMAGGQAAAFNIITDTHQHQIAAWNIAPDVCDREDSMCAVAFRSGRTVVVPDASQDPKYVDNPFVTGRIGKNRFYASSPLIAPGGHVLGTLCVFDTVVRTLSSDQEKTLRLLAQQAVEVLELSRRTRLLDDAVGRLTASNELLADFAGRVSHDLKAPLGVILGFAETLSEMPAIADDPVAGGQLGRIQAAGRRMSRMIGDLLEYAAAGGAVHREQIELRAVVEEVRQDLERQIKDADAVVEFHGDPQATVDADPTELRMFLQNVVDNGVKYRRPDVRPRVTISLVDTSQYWEVMVADNGLGIPADQRENVRQPLVRLARDHSGSSEGTGIGLATCERIAVSHGGRLNIGDTPGGGTTITLRVPHTATA